MSDMSVKEAYRVLQAECGIEVGDRVKVLRMPTGKDGKLGWKERNSASDDITGREYKIEMDNGSRGFALENCGADYPFFVLELVEKAKPELPPIMVGGHEVAFLDDRIRVCGISVKKETLREILKRLEGNN